MGTRVLTIAIREAILATHAPTLGTRRPIVPTRVPTVATHQSVVGIRIPAFATHVLTVGTHRSASETDYFTLKARPTMAKTNYVNTSDEGFSAQLQTFKNTVGAYAVALGVAPATVTAQAADADYFQYVLACQAMMRNGGVQWTGWKDLMRDGGTPPPGGAPVAPTFPTAVPAVAPGIEVRFRNLVKQIKPHANYNEAIGEALGIEGP